MCTEVFGIGTVGKLESARRILCHPTVPSPPSTGGLGNPAPQ